MKLDPLIIRFTKEAKEKLREAAKLSTEEKGRKVSMNAFVVEAALKECQRIFRRFRVDPKDFPVDEQHPS